MSVSEIEALITPFWRLAQQGRKAREKQIPVDYADILGL